MTKYIESVSKTKYYCCDLGTRYDDVPVILAFVVADQDDHDDDDDDQNETENYHNCKET